MDNIKKNENEKLNEGKTSWSSIAGKKHLNIYNFGKIKLMRLTSKSYMKLLENYIKYGIIDANLLDYKDDEKIEIIKNFIEPHDINFIPHQQTKGKIKALDDRNKELNIENLNLKMQLSTLYKYKNRVAKLEMYINYIEDYCDRLLIDNYQEPVFFDKTINKDNFIGTDDEDYEDYEESDYFNFDDEYYNNDFD